MKKIIALVCGFAAVASAADISIVLEQQNPGTFAASDTIDVFLQVTGSPPGEPALGGAVGLRLVQFDLDNMVPVTDWTWDLSTLDNPAFYAILDGATEVLVYSGISIIPGFMLALAQDGTPLKLASFTVANPLPGGTAVNVDLDVTDPTAPSNGVGARVDYGFGVNGSPLPTTLWSGDGTLGGGTGVAMFNVPEPTALALLGLGAVVALRRRA